MNKTAILALAALTFSCAVGTKKSDVLKKRDQKGPPLCKSEGQPSTHAEIATRANSQVFAGCFRNYLKHNPKTQGLSVKFCAHIKTNSQGGVRKASLNDGIINGNSSAFPNDLRWCLEQQLWKLDFSGLQFDSPKILSFPLAFKVRK